MAYIRTKKVKDIEYYYLVESYRCPKTGKVRQRNLKYLGKDFKAINQPKTEVVIDS
jgi:hypothetical protein